ncbi:MAG: GTP 3',8-cyclase MoaA [Spirochaetales bacterium]|nr:GTP 3',8-cyclase MoaA [Spirochaetales bacterium]
MLDQFNREIHYLRISVTDKCNLRCTYCMPEEGVPFKPHSEIMSFEEIVRVVEAAAELGIDKIRLTGGEPLVRRDVVELVRMIKAVKGIEHLGMTTNGVLLDKLAQPLRDAGMDSVNISMDTLNPERYKKITRIGDISYTLKGIDAAIAAGFESIKINVVVMDNTPNSEIKDMQNFCNEKSLTLQLINHYDLSHEKKNTYKFDRPPKCAICNRIRLTADGVLKPCLHSNQEIPVNPTDIISSLKETILDKPENGSVCTNRNMIEIGG